MLDPLTELINNSTHGSMDSFQILEPEKKIVLIFHGASSTGILYQSKITIAN